MNLNYLKAGFAALVIVCMTVLLALDAVDETAGVACITAVMGYILANGVNAYTGRDPAPLLKPTEPHRRLDD